MGAKHTLPDELIRECNEEIAALLATDSKLAELRKTQRMKMEKGDIVGAIAFGKKVNERIDEIINHMKEKYTKYDMSVSNVVGSMTDDEALEFRALLDGMVLLTDTMEGFIVRFNEILGKYRPGEIIVQFDELRKAMERAVKEARKVRYSTSRNAPDFYSDAISDFGDKIYELVLNKAKQMTRRCMKNSVKAGERLDAGTK